ncbi:MAG: acyl carrier protein [Acutalibacteraceae bacterium]|nr:acyl carrier protein [Acutalibacteraceae bacterium]
MIEKIKDIICNIVDVDPDEITLDSRLLGDLGLSSFDLVMFSSEIENEFGVTLSAKSFASIKTVGGIIEFIESNQK